MRQSSSPGPLLCREFVGREHELQALTESLQRAANGQPQFVLLAGEAGVGKTKLCRVFVEASQAQQALVLFGQAIPQDQALPFAPFLDAFRRYFSTSPGRLAMSRSSLLQANFAFLLGPMPELTPLFAAVGSPALESASPVVHQQALFHRVLAGLDALAQAHAGPLLLVLEDLHWADETSLELLAFLAQRLDVNGAPVEPSTPLMLLGTYRPEALPENLLLGRLLAQLHAQRHASEIRVAPLSLADHWTCLNSILEQPAPEQVAHLLFDWDEGNPFFLEELLGALGARGQLQLSDRRWQIAPDLRPRLPPSVTAAILERFLRLPAVDQEVLFYAAVIGRSFDFPLLAALCQLDEIGLVAVLRRAVNIQLICEERDTQLFLPADQEQERYRFRHALTREAIYQQMLASERRLRHQRVAETLESLETQAPPPTSAAPATRRANLAQLLAEHYWLAGLPSKSRPYAMQEAERASRLFAFREERYYLNLAQAGLPEESPERFQLLERIGMLSLGIHDFVGALHWLNMAKVGCQRSGHLYQALQCLASMHLPSWCLARGSVVDMLNELETAAEVALAHPDSANRGVETLVIISDIATYQTSVCQFGRAQRWIERSLELYESLADPQKVPAIQLSLLSRGWIKANQYASVAAEGIAEMRSVLETAVQHHLPQVLPLSYAWLAWMLTYSGRGDEAEAVLAEASDFEARSGVPRPSFVIGWQCFFSGERWEEGIALLRGEMQRLEQAQVPALVAITGLPLVHLLLARDELDEVRRQLARVQPIVESLDEYVYLTQWWWGLAKLQVARGNPLEAQASYERILGRWKTTEDTVSILPILLDGTVLFAETGNRVKASQWLVELEAVVRLTENPVGGAALLEAQGVVHARQGRLEQAIAALRQAVEAWGKLKRGYQQALASQRLAEVLVLWASMEAAGRAPRQAAREEADRLLDQALAVYGRLKVPIGRAAIDALRSGTHLAAQRKRRSTLESRHAAHGLTEREVQVLLQLAAGQSNKAIAATLSLSIGTVELHVSHILTKLSCDTRTQAAAYAITQGWVNRQASI